MQLVADLDALKTVRTDLDALQKVSDGQSKTIAQQAKEITALKTMGTTGSTAAVSACRVGTHVPTTIHMFEYRLLRSKAAQR